jgi:hypothetical protein
LKLKSAAFHSVSVNMTADQRACCGTNNGSGGAFSLRVDGATNQSSAGTADN